MRAYDVVVIGAGIAGMSAAAALAAEHRVLLCESEASSDRHSTGRSAAAFIASYGNASVRALNAASRPWFDNLGGGWSPQSLLHPRPALWIGDESAGSSRETAAAEVAEGGLALQSLTPDQTAQLCPAIVEGWRGQSLLDPDACDIDVASTMAALRRQFISEGGEIAYRCGVRALARSASAWTVTMPETEVSCATVVNAAGAWADEIAGLAGLRPVGLRALRRTIAACTVDAATAPKVWDWPFVLDIDNRFYFKPERAQLLISPADETPWPAGDVKPDPLDVARALDHVNAVTTLDLRSVQSTWAGLRTFAPDRTPVVGPDPAESSFIWAAGQGGYGITISPAIAQIVAASVAGSSPPTLIAAMRALDPTRLHPGS
jgi:D-arginine dehydrogenase